MSTFDWVVPCSQTCHRKWLPWAHLHYSRSDASSFVRESIGAWQEGRAFDFAIRPLEDEGHHVGNVSVWFTSRHARVGEIGYWVRTVNANGASAPRRLPGCSKLHSTS